MAVVSSLPDRGLADLPGDDPAARHRLPVRVVTYWRLRAAMVGVGAVGLLVWAAVGLTWPNPSVRWSVVGIGVIWFFVVGVAIRPVVRRRLFWYSFSDNEIDLQHGWLSQIRTVVPMNRVQHLKSEQGVLARRFDLADLHIHTAAGTVLLHGLDGGEAAEVRTRIGQLAHLADDL